MSIKGWIGGVIGVALAASGGYGIRTWLDLTSPPPETERWDKDDSPPVKPTDAYANKVAAEISRGRDWRKMSVSVYSAPNPKTETSPISLKDLSDHAQAEVVDFVVSHSTASDAVWNQLTRTLTSVTTGIERRDPYRVDRQLVATVTRGLDELPGDRLLWTRVFIRPINFRFTGYTVAATDNKVIGLGSVESTRSTKLSLNVGLSPPLPGLEKQDAGQSLEHSQKTTADLKEQYENLGIDINPRFLRIVRESGVGTDIGGNTFVNLSVVTDPVLILSHDADNPNEEEPNRDPVLFIAAAHLMDGDKVHDGDKGELTVLPQDRLPHCPLKAKVWMLSETRHILTGRSHLQEGRQTVELQRELYEPPDDVEIVPADDISPAVWSILIRPDDEKLAGSDKQTYVKAKAKNGSFRQLVFTGHEIASELTHWLKSATPNADDQKAHLGDLTFDVDVSKTLVPVKTTKEDCGKPN